MEEIKRFIECLLPVTICNLKCSYCYIIQENRRNMKQSKLRYSPEHIALALSKKRLGGTCLISICGAGETMVDNNIIVLVRSLLKEGHFVNVTTNGTLSKKFDDLINECSDYIAHLHVSFSLHYLELLRLNLLDVFFENVKKIKKAGASILVQLNLCDEYIPYIDEIKQRCKEEVGAYPQVALTRNELTKPISVYTSLSMEEYKEYGRKFNSNLFEFTCENFNVKRREFCYAGDWSGVLNLETGRLSKCYANLEGQDIFSNINEPIHFEAVGRSCKNSYCVNSSHFMSLGIIPSVKTPSYAELRNREDAGWYNDEAIHFFNSKLYSSNKIYGVIRKIKISWKNSKGEKNRFKATLKFSLPDTLFKKMK